ncbi:MAG: ATP-binding protein [Deltaproteobacteria bacterium]|nr:ATP-binding protein [Deltaproteobacteria bacterium]
MINRKLKDVIVARLKQFPAVALLGPRQSGKSTLAKTFSGAYYDLEIDQERLRLDLQWSSAVQTNNMIILDEAQTFPEIFPRIRNAIDAKRSKNGRFLILGSVSPALMKQVSESLAGRIAVTELSPIFLEELGKKALDKLWLMGGFPEGGIIKEGMFPLWQRNYLDLIAMRDLPHWGLAAAPRVTQRFFKMTSAIHGTQWNASQIGKSMGLSYHTVNSYLDFLEQVYLLRRLQPYYANIKKRLVKSPKVYWRDTGLLHSLLGVDNFDQLLNQPWVGHSWEGFVVEQVLACLDSQGRNYEPYFFRTSDGYELDLVLVLEGKKWAFEIKLTGSPGQNELDRLKKTAEMIGFDTMVLISRTDKEIKGDSIISTNLPGALKLLKVRH